MNSWRAARGPGGVERSPGEGTAVRGQDLPRLASPSPPQGFRQAKGGHEPGQAAACQMREQRAGSCSGRARCSRFSSAASTCPAAAPLSPPALPPPSGHQYSPSRNSHLMSNSVYVATYVAAGDHMRTLTRRQLSERRTRTSDESAESIPLLPTCGHDLEGGSDWRSSEKAGSACRDKSRGTHFWQRTPVAKLT